jgi:PadR family transcriptional regulator PadR
MTSPKRTSPMLHGTLEALIMKSLAGGKRHGYAIGRWIEDGTGDVIQVEEGSLYPALYRMESRGWIEAEWGQTETNRKAKFYRLTKEGRRRLAVETERWAAFSAAISRVLLPA